MSFRWNYLVRKANSTPSSVATASVLCWRRRGVWKGLFLYHIYASLFCIRQMDEKIEDGSCYGERRWWVILSLCWRVYWDDHRSRPALASFRQIFFRPKPTPPKMFSFIADTRLLQSHFIHFNRRDYRFIVSSCDAFNKFGIHLIASTSDWNATRTEVWFVRFANSRVAAICFMALSNLRHIHTKSKRTFPTTTFPQWQWHGVHSHAKRDKSPNAFTLSRAFW